IHHLFRADGRRLHLARHGVRPASLRRRPDVPWQPPQGQSLPSTFITALLAATDGTLWIATLNGVASWNSGALTIYPELAGIGTSKFLEDRSGAIWLAGQTIGKLTGALCSIPSGAIHCDGADGRLGIGVGDLYQDREGSLWVGMSTGFWRWRPVRASSIHCPAS